MPPSLDSKPFASDMGVAAPHKSETIESVYTPSSINPAANSPSVAALERDVISSPSTVANPALSVSVRTYWTTNVLPHIDSTESEKSPSPGVSEKSPALSEFSPGLSEASPTLSEVSPASEKFSAMSEKYQTGKYPAISEKCSVPSEKSHVVSPPPASLDTRTESPAPIPLPPPEMMSVPAPAYRSMVDLSGLVGGEGRSEGRVREEGANQQMKGDKYVCMCAGL